MYVADYWLTMDRPLHMYKVESARLPPHTNAPRVRTGINTEYTYTWHRSEEDVTVSNNKQRNLKSESSVDGDVRKSNIPVPRSLGGRRLLVPVVVRTVPYRTVPMCSRSRSNSYSCS